MQFVPDSNRSNDFHAEEARAENALPSAVKEATAGPTSVKPKPQRKYGFFAHPILMGDRFVGMLDAEVDREREVLRVNAVHEFLPFEPEETDMVRAEMEEMAQWLGLPLTGLA